MPDHAKKLLEAARNNSVPDCKAAFGSATIFENSQALRIAAETHSYEVFEFMLADGSEDAFGITGPKSFALGEDWAAVEIAAAADGRLQTALNDYNKQVEDNIESILCLAGNDRVAVNKRALIP